MKHRGDLGETLSLISSGEEGSTPSPAIPLRSDSYAGQVPLRSDSYGGQARLLRRGSVVRLEGRRYRVAMVNDCRAYCVPCERETRTVIDRTTGQARQFSASGRGVSISPRSEL